MPVLVHNNSPVSLSSRVFSWDNNGAVLGSALNLADYQSQVGSTLNRDPDSIFANERSVRTVIKFLARNISQVALHSYGMTPAGDRERLRGSKVSQLIANPNPYQTRYEFFYELIVDLCKYERFLAELLRGPNGEYWMVPVPPKLWKFKRNAIRQPTHVEYVDGSIHPTTSGSFFWIDGYPDDVDGMQALYPMLQEDYAAGQYRRNLWSKGARTSGVITRPLDAPGWSKGARSKFMSQWSKVEADGEMAGGTALLEDGMTYTRTRPITPNDAQQLETAKLHEAQAAAAFGVPPVFVGIMDNANYNNVVAFRETLYGDTLGTWFVMLAEAFNARVVTLIGEPGEFTEFNVDAKLRMSFKDRNAMLLQQVGNGTPVRSVNEARRIMNLPSLGPEYDKIIIPSYIQDPDTVD